jgi:hypothetical protein
MGHSSLSILFFRMGISVNIRFGTEWVFGYRAFSIAP